MPNEDEALKERFVHLSNHDLVKVLQAPPGDYSPAEVVIARDELERRRAANARAEAAAHARRENEERTLAASQDRRRQWEYRVQAMALTCPRCDATALPVPDTRDRYGCPSCNHRFAGAPHDVPLPPST